jgi:hypothetical protein
MIILEGAAPFSTINTKQKAHLEFSNALKLLF